MSAIANLIVEFERESTNTLRILERLDTADFGWKPHEKSMTLGALANHVVELHNWVSLVVKQPVLDFQSGYAPLALDNAAALRTALQEIVANGKTLLQGVDEKGLREDWTLKSGEFVIMTLPKADAIRYVVTNHLIHHRGQLSVYLRLLDIPVPGLYGPSADERQ